MTPRQIKARLAEKGINQAALCRMWRKPRVTISYLVNRKMTSFVLEKKLARLLGVSLDYLRDGGK